MLENNVSRTLKRLVSEGLVRKKLKHVKGEKRRKRSYTLTEQGYGAASGIKERVRKKHITLLHRGGEKRRSLGEAVKDAKAMGSDLSLIDLYLHTERGRGSTSRLHP